MWNSLHTSDIKDIKETLSHTEITCEKAVKKADLAEQRVDRLEQKDVHMEEELRQEREFKSRLTKI